MAVSAAQQSSNRGIQNVQVERRAAKDNNGFRVAVDNTLLRQTTQGDLKKKMLPERMIDKQRYASKNSKAGTVTSYRQQGQTATSSVSVQSDTSHLKFLKKTAGVAKWTGLGIAAFISYLQVCFALASAAVFGLYIIYQDAIERLGLMGKAVSSTVNVLTSAVEGIAGWFVGTDIVLSLVHAAWAFWGISILFSSVLFFTFWIWFSVLGIRPFGTIMSFLVTSTCVALSLMPFINIFPWILFWILYINTNSLFLRR